MPPLANYFLAVADVEAALHGVHHAAAAEVEVGALGGFVGFDAADACCLIAEVEEQGGRGAGAGQGYRYVRRLGHGRRVV